MTRTATKARKGAKKATMATQAAPAVGAAGAGVEVEAAGEAAMPAHGAVIDVPLSKLKASPRNARKTAHPLEHVEALAASIAAKGMLQKPVVEPEIDESGAFTGCWLVTIGEGRRRALLLRLERGEIGPDEPVSCGVDLANDPQEISLDENVTRNDLHPADQFDAFLDQSERLGRSAEEIAARFGVSALVVRRRLRLARVSPKLLALYREGELDLDSLMAFAISDDHARQEQVYEALPPYRVDPGVIRRMMTEKKVAATDRRAVFVGAEAYEAAGGTILRDLFTEDRGGWFEDVALLERLAGDKLAAEAERLRAAEGWKWAEAFVDYPYDRALTRVYPEKVERSEDETARMAALSDEYDALLTKWDHLDETPPDVAQRLDEIDAELRAFGDGYAYQLEDVARAGVFVILSHDAELRIERGFLRPEDVVVAAGEDDNQRGEGCEARGQNQQAVSGGPDGGEEEPEDEGAPLSAALVAELTAYRTAGLRDALAGNPDAALRVTVHALALAAFYPGVQLTCADLRMTTTWLNGYAPEVEDSPAMRRIEARRQAWASDLPQNPAELWGHVVGLDHDSLMALLAHCVGQSLNAVRSYERRQGAWGHGDVLASHLRLDMTTTWTPAASSYFGRVTKGRITEAVRQAVSDEAAEKIASLKKREMAEAAEQLVADRGWLPALLRTPELGMPDTASADSNGAGAASNKTAVVLAAE
jgi:ParB family chromosome partitioning protein